jgi:hypothetical protein
MLSRPLPLRGLLLIAATSLAACGTAQTMPGSAGVASGAERPALAARPARTYAYAGSGTLTITMPSAAPQSTQTTISETVSASDGATFGNLKHLVKYAATEKDTSGTTSASAGSVAFVAPLASAVRTGGTDLREIATTVTANGERFAIVTGIGNGYYAQLPNVPAARWSNGPVATTTLTDGPFVQTTAYAADGTYTSASSEPGETANAQLWSNGSGVYSWPFGNVSLDSTFTVSQPFKKSILAVFINHSGFPVPLHADIPLWFRLPPVLAQDSYADMGSATIPAACGVASSFAGKAWKVTQRRLRLDPLFGEVESLERTLYVSNAFGVVCARARDELDLYYMFYNSQSPPSFSNTPLQRQIATETLGLTGETLGGAPADIAPPSLLSQTALRSVMRATAVQTRSFFEYVPAKGRN